MTSSYSDPMKLFEALQKRVQNQASSGGSGSFGNPHILKLKRGQAYSLRLLWLPSDEREYPMINQYVHRIWDNEAVGSKEVSVVCPTSQYDQDVNGFRSCPICDRTSKLYKEAQEGSASADELYKKFKRTLKGYVPVYVVKGPEEDLHKIKILQYTITFKKFFDEKIFGIVSSNDDKKNKNDSMMDDESEESNVIGLNAFTYYNPKTDEVETRARNLLIRVDTKKIPINGKNTEVPDYKIEFSMKETSITELDGNEITVDYFNSINDAISFDKDFYKMSDPKKLNEFKMKYLDGISDDVNESVEEDEEEIQIPVKKTAAKKPVVEEDEEEEILPKKSAKKQIIEEDEDEEEILPKKPAKKPVVEEEPEEEEVLEEKKDSDDDDIDLNEYLKDI